MRKTATMLLSPALLVLLLAGAGLPLRGADVRSIVPDYDEYQPDSRFTVDIGTVKAHRITSYASRVVIETGVSQPVKVKFRAAGVQPLSAYRNQWRIFETDDDSFTVPGARVDPFYLYGLDLPDVVLKKLYYANAAKLIPKVKERLLALHPDLDFPE